MLLSGNTLAPRQVETNSQDSQAGTAANGIAPPEQLEISARARKFRSEARRVHVFKKMPRTRRLFDSLGMQRLDVMRQPNRTLAGQP